MEESEAGMNVALGSRAVRAEADKSKGEIPLTLSRLSKAQELLFDAVQALADDLAPVLREDEPSEEVSMPSEAGLTELGRALDTHAATIEGAAARLRGLRARVEL
jgi:hypothetical protein